MSRTNHFIPAPTAESLKLLGLPECIYLTERGRCKITAEKQCRGKECNFCISSPEDKNSEKHWKKRLCGLNEDVQAKISQKYYGGKMPWRD